jgi:hypothetical protein
MTDGREQGAEVGRKKSEFGKYQSTLRLKHCIFSRYQPVTRNRKLPYGIGNYRRGTHQPDYDKTGYENQNPG